jgi:multidrug resistance protein
MPGRRAAFVFIFITVALDMLALGVIVPVLPKLVLGFEGGDSASAATWVGIFGTIYAAMQFFFAPLLGALSDRFGRRPVVLLSNFGMAADYVVMALAPSVAWLLLGRVLSGLCGATWTVAGAYIADTTPPEQRAARFGIMNAAFGLGFVVGPAVGGLFGAIDPRLPFWWRRACRREQPVRNLRPLGRCRARARRSLASRIQRARSRCCAVTSGVGPRARRLPHRRRARGEPDRVRALTDHATAGRRQSAGRWR